MVKREKSKTHEAQTSRIGRYRATQDGGPVQRARPWMTKTFWRRRVERQRQRLAYARLGTCSGIRRRANSKCGLRVPSLLSPGLLFHPRNASMCGESSTLSADSPTCCQLSAVEGCLAAVLRYAATSGTARATTPRTSLCTEAKAAGNGWRDLDYPLGQAGVDR